MSHGLSNKRIAKKLGIAPETVKSHAKHILLKLSAQTRVEAVTRALSLGMI
jgi:DNA-binding NarL/FixJ family response regulator